MIYLLIFIAVVIGCLMPIQGGINTELTRLLKNPYLAATISFASGTIALVILLLIKGVTLVEIKRISGVHPGYLVGGILGAIFVSSTIFFIPRLGATTMIAAFITGQLLMSVVMDHYGLFGITPNPISASRMTGVLFLFVGLFLVIKKSA